MKGTVAVLGASGFIGSALVERMLAQDELDVVPYVHRSGNAWQLARHGIPLRQIDILNKTDLQQQLSGCTHVVNCTRGSSDVMLRGLRNLLEVCRTNGVERFVHLGSVAVYRGPFPDEPISEDFRGRPPQKGYGWIKSQQDQMVRSAFRKGLSAVILCPPNISGPRSPFLIGLVRLLQTGELALVEDGRAPCPLIDAENLVHAITLALCCDEADGRRIFIKDRETLNWGDVTQRLHALAGGTGPVPRIATDEARRLIGSDSPQRPSLANALKHLVSSEVRSTLRRDPLWARLETTAKSVAKKLPSRWQNRLKSPGNGELVRPFSSAKSVMFAAGPLAQQLRYANYSVDRAVRVLDYEPIVEVPESWDAFCQWYRTLFGLNSEFRDLFRIAD